MRARLARELEKSFGEEKEKVYVLKSVSLNVPEGSLYTFLGPSGCGKTTTLRCVAGLERPERGRVAIDGRRDLGYNFLVTKKLKYGELLKEFKNAEGHFCQWLKDSLYRAG